LEVKLLHSTPLEIADIAICKCYGNEPHSDEAKVKARINRVANVSKHASTIETLVYSFDISDISRACLIELSRHRIASYTVKSSRYTLQELKKEAEFIREGVNEKGNISITITDELVERASKYVVLTGNSQVDTSIMEALENLRFMILQDIPNDIAKYCMPEAYKTSLVMTINARALQNFLELRSSKHALWEIQNLSKAMYDALPENHKFLFDYIYEKESTNGI
jgi:thymidylate synthase (FAD)